MLLKYTFRQARRVVVFIVGMSVLLFGVALIFLPGPAIVVIPLGLLILSTEFIWAKRFLRQVKSLTIYKKTHFNIDSEHLHIESLSEDDYEKTLFLQSDPEFKRYLKHKKKHRNFFKRILTHQEKHGFSIGAVSEKSTGEFVGCAGLIYRNFNGKDIEVVFALLPRYWGHGYAQEMVKGCIDWAFEHLMVDSVVSFSNNEHHRTQHVLEKVGMHLEEELNVNGTQYGVYSLKKKV